MNGLTPLEKIMSVLTYSRDYCQRRGIAPVPAYSAKRFAAVVGDIDPIAITQDHLKRYAAESSESQSTIRGTIKDLITVCKAAGNSDLKQFIRKPIPEPKPTPID